VSLPETDLEHVLEHAAPAFEALRGARVFLTGGTGFFGRWLVESALHANRRLSLGLSLVLLTRDTGAARSRIAALQHEAVTLLEGDVCTFATPTGAFDAIVHAATESSRIARPDDYRARFQTIVRGTERVLDLAATCGAPRLLYVSSGAVYGRQPSGRSHVDETYTGAPDSMTPASAYAEGKRAAELLVAMHAAASASEATVARGFAFVGPGLPLDAHFAAGNFLRDAMAGGKIRVNGDGSAIRSYLYAADLSVWLWTICQCGASGTAYNTGSERAVSIAELASITTDVVGGEGVEFGAPAQSTPPALTNRYVPSTWRARNDLGLAEWVSLEEGLRRTAAWHRAGAA
jgi:dTDP-glucose 4,6-dehydratase